MMQQQLEQWRIVARVQKTDDIAHRLLRHKDGEWLIARYVVGGKMPQPQHERDPEQRDGCKRNTPCALAFDSGQCLKMGVYAGLGQMPASSWQYPINVQETLQSKEDR